jgi:hypothetical protein
MIDNTVSGKIRVYRGKPLRRMHVMVKPTGALCNLDFSGLHGVCQA